VPNDIHSSLERALVAPFAGDYAKQVEQARWYVRDRRGGSRPASSGNMTFLR